VALLVYDMQIGIAKQLPHGDEFIGRVKTVVDRARSQQMRVFFSRNTTLPKEIAGVAQLKGAVALQRVSTISEVQPNFLPNSTAWEIVPELSPCLTAPGHDRQSYVLTGPAAITFETIAELFGRALDRSISYVNLPAADLKAARLAGGEPEWYLDAELELFACWQQGAGTSVTDWIPSILNRSATSYAEFARDYAQTHRQDFLA
jgi:Isochorismatase family